MEDLTSFMVTHVDGVEVYDVLVRVACRLDLAILALTRAGQQQHMPGEIRSDAKLVTTGAELVALVELS